MKFSIITVCLNAKDAIEKTILSVINQTSADYEYLAIDGSSTDGTLAILNQYAGKITKIISEPDNGIYDAMNKGIRLSTGDFLYFLNAGDEFISPNILAEVTAFHKISNSGDVLYGDVQLRYRSEQWIINEKTFCGEIKDLRYLFDHMFSQQRAFFKKSLFDRIGLFDPSYKIIADYDLVMRAYQKGLSFHYFKKAIVSTPLGGYSNRQVDRFIQERLRAMHHLPLRYWYWIFDLLQGALSRGNIQKYAKSKTPARATDND